MARITAALLCLAAAASAAPGNNFLFQRQQCNRDDCLRAVVASRINGGPARGSSDCASFFSTTVTPCPSTTTIVTTTTETAIPVGVTVTQTSVSVEATTLSSTTVVTTVNGGTVTATSTSTLPNAPTGPAKRAVCTGTTRSPSFVPAYASACSGTVRYSSACSCIGAVGKTTVLNPVTLPSTSTSTTTVTPSTTSTITLTTTSTSIQTVVQSATATSVSTVQAFATVQPQSDSFQLYYNSYYDSSTSIEGDRNGHLFATIGDGDAYPFTIDEFGILRVFRTAVLAENDRTNPAESQLVTPGAVDGALRCALSMPQVSKGRLSCSSPGGKSVFYICPSRNNPRRYYIGTSIPGDCQALTLTAR